MITNFDVEYYGKPYLNEDNLKIRPARNYKTMNGELGNDVEYHQCAGDMDYLYDEWKNELGGDLIAVGGLVSGLALGLKRSSHSMVHDSKVKWKKLTPAEKKQIVIPWTKLEEASGKSVILVGDYLYVLIGGAILIYALKE